MDILVKLFSYISNLSYLNTLQLLKELVL